MSLPSQQVNLSLRGGLDRKTDARLVIPSKLTQANDVEFVDHDTLVTRCGTSRVEVAAGYDGLPQRLFEHGGIPIIEFTDGKMLRATGSTVASEFKAENLGTGGNTSTFTRVGMRTSRIQGLTRKEPGVGLTLYGLTYDCALSSSNTYCLVWEQDRQGYVGWSVRDLTTHAEIAGGLITSGASIVAKPRVIYDKVLGQFSIFYVVFAAAATSFNVAAAYVPELGGTLTNVGVVLNTAAGAVVESAVSAAALFDVAFVPTRGYAMVARSTVATGDVHMALLDLNLALIGGTTSGVPAAVPVSLTAHATYSAGVLTGHAIYGAGLNLRGYRLPSSTGVQSAEVTIAGPFATTLVGRVVVTDYLGDLLITFDGFTSTANTFAFINVLRCTTAHVLVSTVNATTITGFVAGRSFTMRGHTYVPVIFTSAQFQSVILVFDLTVAAAGLGTLNFPTSIVARIDWGEVAAPGPLALDSAHRVPACSEFLLPYTKFETNTRLAGVTNNTEVCLAAARFAPTEQLGDVKWNGDTYLAGALPMITDGVNLVEEGFHWNPEIVGTVASNLVTVPPIATGTGAFTFPAPAAYPATYTIAFTESWEDAQGNWHESGVAFLGSVTIAAVGFRDINPTILRPPSLKPNRKLLIYRTLPSSTDTTLYLAQSDQYAVGAVITDANLPNGEPLYTEGGVLGNTPAPSCRQLALFDQRMVIAGCGDGSKLFWSKTQSQGFAAEFVSDDAAFQETVPPDAGSGVATQEMNGKLVVVAEKKIGIIYGSGPSDAGVGRYSHFETVAKDIGALWDSPKSVILADGGIWFQSPFGLRLFGGSGVARDQQGRFIGSEVDDLVVGNAVALSGGTNQQTRFAFPNAFLVWDQVWGQFTSFTNHVSKDACLVGGDYFLVTSQATLSALLRKRDPLWVAADSIISGGTPGSVPVVGDIVLGDIQFGGVQGFQRIRNMLLLSKVNTVAATPSFGIHVGYDNADPSGVAEVTATPAVTTKVVQFEHQFFTQKCETLKLRIKFYDTSGNSTVRLTDIGLSVGVKRGPWKSAEVK